MMGFFFNATYNWQLRFGRNTKRRESTANERLGDHVFDK